MSDLIVHGGMGSELWELSAKDVVQKLKVGKVGLPFPSWNSRAPQSGECDLTHVRSHSRF